MRIGLFFGSFNPIHLGHLNIAQQIINETEIQKIRFVVSPQNPLKTKEELLDAELRLDMVRLSIADNPLFEVSDVEFHLPLPSYTSQTLEEIKASGDKDKFTIIMGSDTFSGLPKWKDVESILAYPILVYKRSNSFKHPFPDHQDITILESPLLDISASRIRQLLNEKKSVKYMVRDEIINLLKTK